LGNRASTKLQTLRLIYIKIPRPKPLKNYIQIHCNVWVSTSTQKRPMAVS